MSALFLATPALTERMVAAARMIAWRSAVDVETMDGLVRKVARGVHDAMVTGAILASANDDAEPPG